MNTFRKSHPALLSAALLLVSLSARGESALPKTSRLTIGGRLHIQYQRENTPLPVSSLIVRRARLTFDAKLTDLVGMKIQIDGGKQKFVLKDAYIGLTPGGLSVYVGQKYVPFSREAISSSKYLQWIERSLTSQFAPFRQIGVGIQGSAWNKRLEYQAGVYNGAVNSSAVSGIAENRLGKRQIYHSDASGSSNNHGVMVVGRLDVHPLGYMKKTQSFLVDRNVSLLSFGSNFYSSDDSPREGHTAGSAQIKKTWAFGVDAAFKHRGFAGTLEYIRRRVGWWDEADKVKGASQSSFTFQGGYTLLVRKLELAVRFEFLDFDGNDVLTGPEGQNRDRWLSFGLNYFIEGHQAKIQLNYIIKKEDMPSGVPQLRNNTLLARFACSF